MTIEQQSDLLTIADVARMLKVSRITVHRWMKQGRLPASRVGPKAVRIRRGDVEALMAPVHQPETSSVKAAPHTISHMSLDAIRPLTDDERRRAREAIKASRELIERMRAERGGEPFDESWPMIREAREERSRQLL